MRPPNAKIALSAVLLAGIAVLTGCGGSKVEIYDVPKETPSPTLPGSAAESSSAGQIVWQKADAWQELAPTAFRKGNYLFDDPTFGPVEITVSSFPGQVGGMLGNVNRWLGQASLPPITQAELNKVSTSHAVAGHDLVVVDLRAEDAGDTDQRIVAAIAAFGGQSWFFKMSGANAAVESQVNAFGAMVDGLEFRDANEAGSEGAESAAAPGEPKQIIFEAPTGWVEKPGSSIRIASYEIAKEGLPPADFSITSFPGDTGGVLANVNRWRGQIGLSAWTEVQVQRRGQKIEKAGLTFLYFDLKADNPDRATPNSERILAAILQSDGRSWFFKLRGDPLLLETQRNKFLSLLDSVHFPAATHK